jgi:hypothetical protein
MIVAAVAAISHQWWWTSACCPVTSLWWVSWVQIMPNLYLPAPSHSAPSWSAEMHPNQQRFPISGCCSASLHAVEAQPVFSLHHNSIAVIPLSADRVLLICANLHPQSYIYKKSNKRTIPKLEIFWASHVFRALLSLTYFRIPSINHSNSDQ